MPSATATGLGGARIARYIDGYRLLQSFTTGGTAQGLQTTPITSAALLALTGVMSLDGADGASFIFARTSGATTLTAWVTGFEPIIAADGSISAYIEKPLSSTAAVALTTGILVTTVTLDPTTLGGCYTTAPGVTTIPTTALFVSSSGSLTGAMLNFVKEDAGTTSGIAKWNYGAYSSSSANAPNGGAQGVTHVRVLLSCATASESIFCLAKRLRGQAEFNPNTVGGNF